MRRLCSAHGGRTVFACSNRMSARAGAFGYILGDKGSGWNGRWRDCDGYGNLHRILEQSVIFILGIGSSCGYWMRYDDFRKMGAKKTNPLCTVFMGCLYGGDAVRLRKKQLLKRCISVAGFEIEGVFTVEAALVVPIVIGCMLFVILMAFIMPF